MGRSSGGILPAHGYFNGDWTGEECLGLHEDNLALRIGRELGRLTGGPLLRWTPDALCAKARAARRAIVEEMIEVHVHACAESVSIDDGQAICPFPPTENHTAEYCREVAREIAERMQQTSTTGLRAVRISL